MTKAAIDIDTLMFGAGWKYGEPREIARFEAQEDGLTAVVYEERLPARFWSVKVLGRNGEELYELGTGSGGDEMMEYAKQTAQMISEGMLVMRLSVAKTR